jgi:hypothetical protein
MAAVQHRCGQRQYWVDKRSREGGAFILAHTRAKRGDASTLMAAQWGSAPGTRARTRCSGAGRQWWCQRLAAACSRRGWGSSGRTMSHAVVRATWQQLRRSVRRARGGLGTVRATDEAVLRDSCHQAARTHVASSRNRGGAARRHAMWWRRQRCGRKWARRALIGRPGQRGGGR